MKTPALRSAGRPSAIYGLRCQGDRRRDRRCGGRLGVSSELNDKGCLSGGPHGTERAQTDAQDSAFVVIYPHAVRTQIAAVLDVVSGLDLVLRHPAREL